MFYSLDVSPLPPLYLTSYNTIILLLQISYKKMSGVCLFQCNHLLTFRTARTLSPLWLLLLQLETTR